MREALGIDIGGVLSRSQNEGRNSGGFANAELLPGAIAVVTRLVQERFGGNVYLVSKCGWNMQLRTKIWLREQNFYTRTGIEPDQAWFCKERHEKAGIAQVLGLTHFIDDRLEVLSYLTTVPHKFLFQPSETEVGRHAHALPSVTRVADWESLEHLLLPA